MIAIAEITREKGEFCRLVSNNLPSGLLKLEIDGSVGDNLRLGIQHEKDGVTEYSWIYLPDKLIDTGSEALPMFDHAGLFVEGISLENSPVSIRLTYPE
jgi:hypothetical protein